MTVRALLLVCLLSVAGCGGDGGSDQQRSRDGTRLVVDVWAKGRAGLVDRRVVSTVPEGLDAEDFEPVPPDVACAEIYGGPAVARVGGTLAGTPIDSRFSRVNACETARWERVEALLGAPA